MAESSPARVSQSRSRLLKFVRSAFVALTFSADDHGDYVAVDASAYRDLVKWMYRLADFEAAHDDDPDS